MAYNFNTSSNRRISFGGSGRSTGFNFSLPKSSRNKFTEQQMIALAELMKRDQEKSILGSIFQGGKSSVAWALRQISRPNWAVAEGTRRALEGEGFDMGDFFKGFSRGIQAKKHTTFSDVLKQEGVLEGHGRIRAVAGLGLDVLTDPTLPLLIAGSVMTGGAASPLLAARVAMRGATIRGLEKGGTAAAKRSLDEAAAILENAGYRSSAARTWVSHQREKINAIERGTGWDEVNDAALAAAEKAAMMELDDIGTRVFQARYFVPFSGGRSIPLTPTHIAGKRVAPKTPKLARTAKGEGALALIPGASRASQTLGKIFKHGFDSPEFAKPALIMAHAAENLMDNYIKEGSSRFGQFAGRLSEDDRLDVLGWAERQGSSLLDGNRNLIGAKIERATGTEITPDQADFLRQWHGYWEKMRQRDHKLGIDYTPVEGIYVPHIYTREGGVAGLPAVMDQIGYTKNRKELRAIDELKRIKEQGLDKKYNLEVDIMRLASARTRRAAQAHGNQILKEHMRRTHGVPIKVADVGSRRAAKKELEALREKARGLPVHTGIRRMRANHTRATEKWAREQIDNIEKKSAARMAELEAKMVNAALDAAEVAGKPRTPTFKSIAKLSAEKFNNAIKHFKPKDRTAARNLHGAVKEVARLRRQLAQLEAKGAHGSKYRSLADDAVRAGQRIGVASKRESDVLTKDTSKEKIGYIAQPQGRTRVADTPKGLKKKERPIGEYLKPTNTSESWKKNIQTHLQAIEDQARADWNRLVEKYPSPRRTNAAAREAQARKARETVIRNTEKAIADVGRKVEFKKARFEEELARKFDIEAKTLESILAKEQSLVRRSENAMKRNPRIPQGYVKYQSRLSGERYAFPPEIHHAMSRVERILDDEDVMAGFTGQMRKLMAIWKVGVTSVNPGYRIRNTLSDLWNMYIDGVPTARIMQYGAKAAAYQRAASTASKKLADAHAANRKFKLSELSRTERRALELYNEAYTRGVMSGLFQGDIQIVAGLLREGSITAALMKRKRPDLAFARMAQTFNRHGENWGRLTHYLYRRDYQKLTPAEATEHVKRAHFDYEELTPVEQQKFKAWLPFYTWTRKNIPYQMVQMVQRPGKYATFPKVMATSNELATGDTETADDPNMPDWMRERFAFRVPFGDNTYMVPQIGVTDLSKLEHPSEFITSLVGPHIKVPIELATGKSFLTGQSIQGGVHPRNPVADWAANTLGAIPGNPLDVGVTARNVKGEMVQGAGASPWVSYFAGQLPMSNYFVNRLASIKREQQGGVGPIGFGSLSYLGGVSMYERDLESDMAVAQIEFQETMRKLIRGLRDEGKLPNPERKKGTSPYQMELDRLLSGG